MASFRTPKSSSWVAEEKIAGIRMSALACNLIPHASYSRIQCLKESKREESIFYYDYENNFDLLTLQEGLEDCLKDFGGHTSSVSLFQNINGHNEG